MGCLIHDEEKLWSDGEMPYEIDEVDFPIGTAIYYVICRAISMWILQTRVTLRSREEGDEDYVVFVKAKRACRTPVGRVGGRQQIGCYVGEGFGAGTVLHEIGHAFGFHHEQCRSDRDTWVQVVWSNLAAYSSVHFSKPRKIWMPTEYDLSSIMHYGPKALSKNGLDTMVAQRGSSIRENKALSAGDIASIAACYSDKSHPEQGSDHGKVAALKALGFPAKRIAVLLRKSWGVDAQLIAKWLEEAGFGQEGLTALKAAGFSLVEVATAYRRLGTFPVEVLAEWLREAGLYTNETKVLVEVGFDLSEIVLVRRLVWKRFAFEVGRDLVGSGKAMLTILSTAGYELSDIASAWKGLKVGGVADLLKGLDGGCSNKIAAFKEVGYSANEVAGACADSCQSSAEALAHDLELAGFQQGKAAALREAGYSAEDIARAYRELWCPSAAKLMQSLWDAGFTQNKTEALKAAGYGAREIANAFKILWGTSAEPVGKWLKEAGFPDRKIGPALRSVYGLSEPDLKALLLSLVSAAGD